MALPQNPTIVAENARFSSQNGELIINADDRSIINWDSFSIDVNERVEFVQPTSKAMVLNRVIGNDPSSIFGSLSSNGQVVLLNQHGILFDATSRIDTGSFIASSFDLIDSALHKDARLVFQGSSKGSISFFGQIDASGDFYVVSDSISQEGPIRVKEGDAGFFALGKMELGETAPHSIFERTACQGLEITIKSLTRIDDDRQFFSQSGVLSFLSSVDNTSLTTTQNSIFAAGSVIYLGDTAALTASRKGNGGDIFLGGVERGNPQVLDRSSVVVAAPGAVVHASAGSNGDGGKIILWSERNTEFSCDLNARGGETGGDGGFIEVSSRGNLGIYGMGSTLAPMGKTGTFLIDPSDVTINNVANVNTVPGPVYSFTGSPATILNATLTGLLAGSNVLIDTSNGVGSLTGNITVLNNVSWASAFSLNLTAVNGSITIRATVENTGGVGAGGNLTLNASGDVILDAITPGAAVLAGTRNGTINVTAGGNIRLLAAAVNNASATIGTTAAVVNNAVFNITAGNDIQLIGNNATNAFALIGSSAVQANTGTITLMANNDLILTAGTITGSFAAIGSSAASNSTRAIMGTIGRNITMTGGAAAATTFASIGSAGNATNAGTISLNAMGNVTLQAGTGTGGFALIGGVGANTRDITVTSGNNMQLLGRNAFALIGSSSTTTDSGTMNIMATNDLTLSAGTVAGAFAAIGSSAGTNSNRPMTITVGHDLTLNGGSAAGTTTYAAIGSGGNAINIGTITVNVTRNTILQAGIGTGGFALIGGFRETNRAITVTAGNNIQVLGQNAFALIGSSSITTDAGNLIIGANNDLTLRAGAIAGSFAAIGSSGTCVCTRPITITVGNDLSMSGGGSTTSFASIGSAGSTASAINSGTINIDVARNATLQGGTGVGGFVLIGGFRQTSRAINMNVTQDLSITAGSGGSGVGSPFAAIGSFNNGVAPNPNNGDITVNVGRNLNITGGTTTSIIFTACAGIMRAGEGTGITSFTSGTNFNVNVGNNLTLMGGTIIPAGTGATAYIGFGGFRIQGATAGTQNVGNINLNVGRNLEMISSSGGGAGHIVGGTQRQVQGNVTIKVGENFYMHNLPIIGTRFLGNSVGGSGTFNNPPWQLNFFVTVGKNLTIDARNNGFNSFHCFNGSGDYVNQGIVQFHIGGDVTFIGGNQNRNDTATIWLHPNLINEIWVGGNWRAYNGNQSEAGVEPNVLFATGNIGRPDWRAGGNIVVAGAVFGLFGPDNNLFTTTQPIFIQADYPFSPGQLWTPQSAIVNGSNIFLGTPLAATSTNTSTVAPFHSGGDGLGGFAVDTNEYNLSLIAFPTTVNGPSWSTANPVAPAAPSAFAFLVKSYTAGITGPANLTILTSDVFDNASPADFIIGTSLQTVTLRSVQGDILVQGFRDTTLVDFNSALADAGTITIDTVRDLFGIGSTTTAGTDINLTAGRDIALSTGNMLAGVNLTQQAEDNISLTDSLESAAAGDIVSLAGNNSTFINSSATANNNIDWVIDNDFPIMPLIGPFGFNMDATSSFSAGLGYIRVYTARQGQNNISPLAQFISNGSSFSFVPGSIFSDTDQEKWCTYYPNGTLGIPFRIFYKDCFVNTVQQAMIIVDQFLVDLHPYNEFPGWIEQFSIDSRDMLIRRENYFFRRRNLNVINQPKSYTVWLGDTLE